MKWSFPPVVERYNNLISSEDFHHQSENCCPVLSQWGENRREIEIIFLQNVSSLFNASITHNL